MSFRSSLALALALLASSASADVLQRGTGGTAPPLTVLQGRVESIDSRAGLMTVAVAAPEPAVPLSAASIAQPSSVTAPPAPAPAAPSPQLPAVAVTWSGGTSFLRAGASTLEATDPPAVGDVVTVTAWRDTSGNLVAVRVLDASR